MPQAGNRRIQVKAILIIGIFPESTEKVTLIYVSPELHVTRMNRFYLPQKMFRMLVIVSNSL